MKKLLRCSLLGLLLLCSVVVNGAQVPKYIFLFIGDGMGFNHVEATQIYAEKEQIRANVHCYSPLSL